MNFFGFLKNNTIFLLFSLLVITSISFPAFAADSDDNEIWIAPPQTEVLQSVVLSSITQQPTATHNFASADIDKDRIFNVLQLDGGGVRGAFSAQVLRGMHDQTEIAIYKIFQGGITGTSTGSIIALALTCPQHRDKNDEWKEGPYSPKEIVAFYSRMADDVFKCWTPQNCWTNLSSGYQEGCLSGLVKTISTLVTCGGCGACCKNCAGFCGPRYSNHTLRQLLNHMFGDMTLGQSLVPVQAVAYDTRLMSPQYFTSYTTPRMRLADAALCSSAAPTFFPGVSVPLGDDTLVQCVDGGLIDNSAAFAALSLAKTHFSKRFPNEPTAHFDDFILCSVGTGEPTPTDLYKDLKHAGKLGWAGAAVEIGISGRSQATKLILDEIYGTQGNGAQGESIRQKYFRIQTNLSDRETQMDDPDIIPGVVAKASTITRGKSGPYNDFMRTYFSKPPVEEERQLANALLSNINCPLSQRQDEGASQQQIVHESSV